MKRVLTAALASFLLAGVLAGITESPFGDARSVRTSLSDGSCPAPLELPVQLSYGESISR